MRRFIPLIALALGAFLISVAKAEGDNDEVILYGAADGKSYTSVIDRDALRKCPAWIETAENPPVSVRKAMRLADAKRQQLVHDTAHEKWRRESISLEYLDLVEDVEPSKRFYWRIRYDLEAGGGTGPSGVLDLAVLMDGKLVEPVVAKDEDN